MPLTMPANHPRGTQKSTLFGWALNPCLDSNPRSYYDLFFCKTMALMQNSLFVGTQTPVHPTMTSFFALTCIGG